MTFKCFHCGQCCENVTTQIAVTISDVQRLSLFLGKSVEELIPGYISLNPFGQPDSDKYELELGLNIPCRFRKNGRCIVYSARPINCRLFPTWIVARAPLNEINKVIDKENKCSRNKYSALDQKNAKNYMKTVGTIFDFENKITEKTIPKRTVKISDFPGHEMIEALCSHIANEREREKIRIPFIKQHIKVEDSTIKAIKRGLENTSFQKLPKTKPF